MHVPDICIETDRLILRPPRIEERRLGSTCRGPGRLPALYEDSPTEIWVQARGQWRLRRAMA